MYSGNENLINDGQYLPYSVLDFWQWAYSNLIHNVSRGTFAEFIVKSALEQNNIPGNCENKTGFEPYDLDGPIIPFLNRASRIEVKSAAFVQQWDIKHPDRTSFGIAPAKLPDETGDYPQFAEKQRNNDLYVFTLYTAKDRRDGAPPENSGRLQQGPRHRTEDHHQGCPGNSGDLQERGHRPQDQGQTQKADGRGAGGGDRQAGAGDEGGFQAAGIRVRSGAARPDHRAERR